MEDGGIAPLTVKPSRETAQVLANCCNEGNFKSRSF
jgi:hypothetical protein